MNLTLKTLVATAALTVISASASAWARARVPGTHTPRIDQRQANQEQRIDQGVASGALTRREVHRLAREQVVIDRAENRAKADGAVTAQERQRLHGMQSQASSDIRFQKHDRQRAPIANRG
jgi:hypothetical protein